MVTPKVWYTVPNLVQVSRGDKRSTGVSIKAGFANNNNLNVLGIDEGLTLDELEDLLWRVRQGIHLVKTGRLLKSKA